MPLWLQPKRKRPRLRTRSVADVQPNTSQAVATLDTPVKSYAGRTPPAPPPPATPPCFSFWLHICATLHVCGLEPHPKYCSSVRMAALVVYSVSPPTARPCKLLNGPTTPAKPVQRTLWCVQKVKLLKLQLQAQRQVARLRAWRKVAGLCAIFRRHQARLRAGAFARWQEQAAYQASCTRAEQSWRKWCIGRYTLC